MANYIVKAGDTLVAIARRHYGSSSKYREIATHNRLLNPDQIYEGQTLELPSFESSTSNPFEEGKRTYRVRYGDTLWSIAEKTLGNPTQWPEIARLNNLDHPELLLIGQPLILPSSASPFGHSALTKEQQPVTPSSAPAQYQQKPATGIPGRGVFVVSDEFNPFRPKLVRKDYPGKKGFQPRDMNSRATPGRHVMGDNKSKYISASKYRFGAPRFKGKRYWIDVNLLKKGGGVVHDAEQIELDFKRIEKKYATNPNVLEKIKKGRKFLKIDREVLIEGPIPSRAVKTGFSMFLTRSTQIVEGYGLVMTAYNIGSAGYESYEKKTLRPLGKEVIRQAGGWSGAWLGARLGGAIGTAVSVETGPGALIIGGIGAFIGGFVGFYRGDWIAGYLDVEPEENKDLLSTQSP